MVEVSSEKLRDKLPIQQPVYIGSHGRIFGILFANMLFAILTIGIYTFWGKTKVRRYLWSNIKFLNEPFAYLGNGLELFKSYAKFSLMIVLPAIILITIVQIVFGKDQFEIVRHIMTVFLVIVFTITFMYAKFTGMRYRLGRTVWRGIRFQLRGDPRAFVRMRIKIAFYNLITLGLYKPMGDVSILRYVVNNIYFGNLAFRYTGQIKELQKTYFICWLLILPTLGFSRVWYRAKYYAHVAKYTRLGNMEFRCKMEASELFFLQLTNALMIVFSLGFAYPFAVHRKVSFITQHIRFRGNLDYALIGQAQKSAGGEGAEIYLGADDIGF